MWLWRYVSFVVPTQRQPSAYSDSLESMRSDFLALLTVQSVVVRQDTIIRTRGLPNNDERSSILRHNQRYDLISIFSKVGV